MKNPNLPEQQVSRRSPMRVLLSWHRRMGVISALFVVILSLSGLVLHHATRLNLDARFIDSNALLSWYAIELPAITSTFALGTHEVSQIENAVYFDTARLPVSLVSLQGAAKTDFGHVVAGDSQLILLTPEGGLIEVLGSQHGVPRTLMGIGVDSESTIYLRGFTNVFSADLDLLVFVPAEQVNDSIRWSEALEKSRYEQEIRQDYGRSLLTWERILLDIHSGRFLGNFGVILVDVMSLLFLMMAITGIWIWSKRRRQA